MSRRNRTHKTQKFVDEEAEASDNGDDEIREIKAVEKKELADTLRGKVIDDTEYYDDGASRKYDLQREERISEELREASEDVRRVRNRKRKPFDGAEGEEPQVAENEVPVVKKCREDLAVQRMLEEETRKAEELKSGDFMDAIFRCPLCFIPMTSSTSDEGKTRWWCPAKCLLPWTTDEKKPVLYAELRIRVLDKYKNPHPVPNCKLHGEQCKLEVVRKDKCKDERLVNQLFFTCARKKEDNRCSFVMSAEFDGQKGEAFSLMFQNRKNKIERMESANVQAANFAYEAAMKRVKAELLKRDGGKSKEDS